MLIETVIMEKSWQVTIEIMKTPKYLTRIFSTKLGKMLLAKEFSYVDKKIEIIVCFRSSASFSIPLGTEVAIFDENRLRKSLVQLCK